MNPSRYYRIKPGKPFHIMAPKPFSDPGELSGVALCGKRLDKLYHAPRSVPPGAVCVTCEKKWRKYENASG